MADDEGLKTHTFVVTNVEMWDMATRNLIADFGDLAEAMDYMHDYFTGFADEGNTLVKETALLLTFDSGYTLAIGCEKFTSPEELAEDAEEEKDGN